MVWLQSEFKDLRIRRADGLKTQEELMFQDQRQEKTNVLSQALQVAGVPSYSALLFFSGL